MEFEDKNLKAAVRKAAKALKVPPESLQYEVLSYGSTGIFGLVGAKKSKIRVISPKAERHGVKTKAVKKEMPRKEETEKAPPDELKDVQAETENAKLDAETENAKLDAEIENAELDADAIDLGRRVTQKIVDKITENATVRVKTESERVVFHVEGGKTAILIGKRGQTLEAIQYLVDRIVNKKSEKRIRLQIDVAGYLENKKTNLEQRAFHLAEKVKKTGKPVTVGELNVYDRKIVHMSLKENRDVRTQSMGSGFYRKLVIFPKKGPVSKKNRQRD